MQEAFIKMDNSGRRRKLERKIKILFWSYLLRDVYNKIEMLE